MQKLDQDLSDLKSQLMEMGERAVQMVTAVLRAFTDRDAGALAGIEADEDWVNRAQVELDRKTIHLITIYGPAAMDLRFLMMVARITSDLERIGDLAMNTRPHVAELNQQEPSGPLGDLQRMGELSIDMVRESLRAFQKDDAALARDTLGRDDEVDALYDHITDVVVGLMMQSTAAIPRSLGLITLARSLERIADHATNVC